MSYTLEGAPRPHPSSLLPVGAVFAVAVIGRLPVLGAWWQGADWGLLAQAAGVDGPGGTMWPVARLFWALGWSLAGLDAGLVAGARLLLHGLAAVLVTRIAARSGLGRRRRVLAGIVYGVSPLGFGTLYAASGLGELLAAIFALAAVERWLTGNRRALGWATLCALLAAGSAPTALGLPVVLLACAWAGAGVRPDDKAFAWAMILIQILGSVMLAAAAVGPDGLPGMAEPLLWAGRLGAAGWWLVSPAPTPAADVGLAMSLAGGLLLLGWAAWAARTLGRDGPLALLALVGTLAALAPAVLAGPDPLPASAHLATAGFGIMLGALVPRARVRGNEPLRTPSIIGLLVLAATTYGFFSLEVRLGARQADGTLTDPMAHRTALSWQACRTITNLRDRPQLSGGDGGGLTHLVLYQPLPAAGGPLDPETLGERWTRSSPLHDALGGNTAPRLLLGGTAQAAWANGLTGASSRAVVLCETPTGFRMWGRTSVAVLYAALTDVAGGRFERARGHLKRSASLAGEQVIFAFDEGQMVVPLESVLERRAEFIDWTVGLLDQGASRLEVGGLQDHFLQLLSRATGRSMDELTAGSHLVGPPREPVSGPGPDGP